MQNSYSARSSPYFGRRSQASEESFRCLQELHYYRIRQGQFNICMSSLRLLDQLVRSFRRHPPRWRVRAPSGTNVSAWGSKNPPRCAPDVLGLAGPTLGPCTPTQLNGAAWGLVRRWGAVVRTGGTVPPGPSPERVGVRGVSRPGSSWPLLNCNAAGAVFPPPGRVFFLVVLIL